MISSDLLSRQPRPVQPLWAVQGRWQAVVAEQQACARVDLVLAVELLILQQTLLSVPQALRQTLPIADFR